MLTTLDQRCMRMLNYHSTRPSLLSSNLVLEIVKINHSIETSLTD